MYYKFDDLKISTPMIINVLEKSGFTLTLTDTETTLKDNNYKRVSGIRRTKVINYLKTSNDNNYMYMANLLEKTKERLAKDTTIQQKLILLSNRDKCEDMLEKLYYYTAITLLVPQQERVLQVLKAYIKLRDTPKVYSNLNN